MDRLGARHPTHLRRDGDLRLSLHHGTGSGAARPKQRLLPLYPRPRRASRRAIHIRLPHGRSRPRADPLVAKGPATGDAVGAPGTEILVRGGRGVRRRTGADTGARGAADRRALARVRCGPNSALRPSRLNVRITRSRRLAGHRSTVPTGDPGHARPPPTATFRHVAAPTDPSVLIPVN